MLLWHWQSIALWCFSGGRITMSGNTWPALSTEIKREHCDGVICLLITFSVSWDTTNKHRSSLWRSLFNRGITQQHDSNITTSSLCSRLCHLLLQESLCQWQLWTAQLNLLRVSYSLKVLSGKNSAELIPKLRGQFSGNTESNMRNIKVLKFLTSSR